MNKILKQDSPRMATMQDLERGRSMWYGTAGVPVLFMELGATGLPIVDFGLHARLRNGLHYAGVPLSDLFVPGEWREVDDIHRESEASRREDREKRQRSMDRAQDIAAGWA